MRRLLYWKLYEFLHRSMLWLLWHLFWHMLWHLFWYLCWRLFTWMFIFNKYGWILIFAFVIWIVSITNCSQSISLSFLLMKETVIKALDNINNSPKYIEGIYHSTDMSRLYEVAIAVYENSESTEDVKEYLSNNLSDDFAHRETVLRDCMNFIDAVVPFLSYINYGK